MTDQAGTSTAGGEAPVFTAPDGTYRGWTDGDVVRATGIRYARAARFELPVDERTPGVTVDATDWAPACPQLTVPDIEDVLGTTMSELPRDEDCLRLSVTRPATESKDPRPVMVWIHGGAYILGSGDAPTYDPALLVEEQDVIVVAVTFRLGLLGFLGGYRGRPANLGLFDILSALRWINRNIESFGGDAGNVTMFGESAGGDAIAHLLAVPGTETYFHRAIIQSAPFGLRHGRDRMCRAMGKIAAKVDESSEFPDIRRAQIATMKGAIRYGLAGMMPYGVQYGHDPLPPATQVTAAWRQRAPQVDVLVGSTVEELSLFTDRMPALVRLRSVPVIGKAVYAGIVAVGTRVVFAVPAKRFASMIAAAGARTYHYTVSWGRGRTKLGAAHFMDIPLILGRPELWATLPLVEGIGEDEIAELGPKVREVWGRFARTGRLEEKGKIRPKVLSWERV